MSNNRRKASLEDFQLFYEELVFNAGTRRGTRVRRPRSTVASVK